MAWTEVDRVTPKDMNHRVRCSVPECSLNARPPKFSQLPAAQGFAEYHANETRHTAIVESNQG